MDFLKDPEFWVLVGFLVFFGFLGNTFWKLIKGGLDGRTAKVRDQLAEATRLRAEAQAVLEDYRAKQAQAVRDAADILAQAREEAERMRHEGEEELSRSLAAREAQALDRIAFAEQAALKSVKDRAVEIAIRAATGLVSDAIDSEAASSLLNNAIDELPRRARA